jgi:L-malate glycosyltransferase
MGDFILIISTDATRTGTPLLLLDTLKWFKINTSQKFILILNDGGELLDEFRSLTDVYLWPEIISFGMKKHSPGFSIYKGLRRILKIEDFLSTKLFVNKLIRIGRLRLIYCNSARNGSVLKCLNKYLPGKILTYVHEGERILNYFDRNGSVTYNLNISNEIVTVSDAVKEVLLRRFKLKQKINVIPGGVNTRYIFRTDSRILLKNEGIPDDAFIIMCCGWLSWHKGTDLFIQIARILSSVNKMLHFVWVGGESSDQEYINMCFDIEKLKLSDRITIITSKPDAVEYINLADIFLMLSREESFSLVTVEAGLAKKPVLCFENSGGPVEIVNHDRRYIIPYGDLGKLCERILQLFGNPDERVGMGNDLYKRVLENYSIEKSAGELFKRLNEAAVSAQ